MILNEHDVEQTYFLTQRERSAMPLAARAAETLMLLVDWTNSHSDGWPYWAKPSRASQKLQERLQQVHRDYIRGKDLQDLDEAEYKALLRPIKAFLTRQGVDHAEIIR